MPFGARDLEDISHVRTLGQEPEIDIDSADGHKETRIDHLKPWFLRNKVQRHQTSLEKRLNEIHILRARDVVHQTVIGSREQRLLSIVSTYSPTGHIVRVWPPEMETVPHAIGRRSAEYHHGCIHSC